MFKPIITAAALALGVTLSTAHAAEEATQPEQPSTTVPNPFDPNSWTSAFSGQGEGGNFNWFDPNAWGMGGAAQTSFQFNPAHPAGWMMWVDPTTHVSAHMAFANPATYAQFMQPQFWMQFANPNNWMAWMNPASYSALFNPATYAYWMNPSAYVHAFNPGTYTAALNPANYMAFINPMTYLSWMNPAAYTLPTGEDNAAAINWFDPSTWASMVPGQATGQQPAEETK